VLAAKILDNGCNLDIKNPSAKEDLEHLPPEKLVENIVATEQKIVSIMGEIKSLLAEGVR
jgi:type I restriction enzyme M protein